MQRILAIARLTWKSAFRYRLFWVMAALLVAAVVGLPLILKDDGTAEGLTQILLTYTLSAITVLLGMATLWLSCGTLARDVEDCQMQVVCAKPIARWQVWLGKLLGILALNAMLLALSGAVRLCPAAMARATASRGAAGQTAQRNFCGPRRRQGKAAGYRRQGKTTDGRMASQLAGQSSRRDHRAAPARTSQQVRSWSMFAPRWKRCHRGVSWRGRSI